MWSKLMLAVSLEFERELPLMWNEIWNKMVHIMLERWVISTFASKAQVNLVLSCSSKMRNPEMSCRWPAPGNFPLFFWGEGQREDIKIRWIGLGFAHFGPLNPFWARSYFRGCQMPRPTTRLLSQHNLIHLQCLGHLLCPQLLPLLTRTFPIALLIVSQGWTQHGTPGSAKSFWSAGLWRCKKKVRN